MKEEKKERREGGKEREEYRRGINDDWRHNAGRRRRLEPERHKEEVRNKRKERS